MRTALALLLVSLVAASAGARPLAVEPELRVNPFERPDLSEAVDARSDAGADGQARWRPVLRGTLVAGSGSLANLGGTVLGLGEEAHGYRLREVRTFEAVFDKGDATLVLPVESDPEGER